VALPTVGFKSALELRRSVAAPTGDAPRCLVMKRLAHRWLTAVRSGVRSAVWVGYAGVLQVIGGQRKASG
jgi:hypothetical protein